MKIDIWVLKEKKKKEKKKEKKKRGKKKRKNSNKTKRKGGISTLLFFFSIKKEVKYSFILFYFHKQKLLCHKETPKPVFCGKKKKEKIVIVYCAQYPAQNTHCSTIILFSDSQECINCMSFFFFFWL